MVRLNDTIAGRLGMTMTGPVRKPSPLSLPSEGWLARTAERLDFYRRLDTLPGRRARRMSPIDWACFDEVVASLRQQLLQVAGETKVSKDPRFSWTLPVWLAAGADVEHVIFTSRKVEAMLASRQQNRLVSFSSASDAKNSLIYSIGVALSSCWDNDVDYTLLRFPDFLGDLELLHGLPLLRELDWNEFEKVAADVVRSDLVHHG